MFRSLIALAALLAAFAARAEGPAFYGYAYDLKTGAYLYTEVHNPRFENGREVSSLIRYYAPDGQLIGQKPLDYSRDAFIPVYRLELLRSGYAEGIAAGASGFEMLKVDSKGKPEKRKPFTKEALMAADSGFHHLVQAQLPRLLNGETVPFKFVVAGRLDSFRFAARKVGDGSFEGKPAVKLLVQADSLLRYVAPDLNLLYDPASKKLLEYRGVSNIHDPATGKAYNARIVYFSQPPPDAPKNLPALTP